MAEPQSRIAAPPLVPEFRPYIPDSATIPEFTPRAVILGMLFGIIFGAVTVYVGLRAGLTVSASIPIAVLSISLLRALGRPVRDGRDRREALPRHALRPRTCADS